MTSACISESLLEKKNRKNIKNPTQKKYKNPRQRSKDGAVG